MTTASVLDIRQLSDAQLADAWSAGHIDLDALESECARRDHAAQAKRARSDKARAAARKRHADRDDAAYANYRAAEDYCRGDANMLSEAGKRTGRAAWPMLWEATRETADKLASDDLIRFWDYVAERPPSASEYAAVKAAERYDSERADIRDGAPIPEQAQERPATPSARELAEQAATAPRTAARPAGGMARYITALRRIEQQADRTARAMARVGGGR